MDEPPLLYNKDMFEHIRNMPRDKKKFMVGDLEQLGKGAAGTTFISYLKPRETFPEPIVLKEEKRNRFCANEFEALKFLREQMVAGKIPGYFIFMYGCFVSGNKKYIIMEKADICLDDYLIRYNLTNKTYLQIFYHIANAVSYLEKFKFNHGDLWSENVLLTWLPDQDDVPEEEQDFYIKLIDYDSAFKENSQINSPSYGGADKYRTKFILGYDLNRFFDGLIYSYESYVEKKTRFKEEKIAELKKLKRKDKKVHVPTMDEQDDDDRSFDDENIIYPQEIIDFMYRLGPSDPCIFDDCPDMSGEAVKKLILSFAMELKIDLYSNEKDSSRSSDGESDIPQVQSLSIAEKYYITFKYSFNEHFQQEDFSIQDVQTARCNGYHVCITNEEYEQCKSGDLEYTIRIVEIDPLKVDLIKNHKEIDGDNDPDNEYDLGSMLNEFETENSH